MTNLHIDDDVLGRLWAGLAGMSNYIDVEFEGSVGYGDYKVSYGDGNISVSGPQNVNVKAGKNGLSVGIPTIFEVSQTTQKTSGQTEKVGDSNMFTWNEQTTTSVTLMGIQKSVQVTNTYMNSGVLIKSDTMVGTNLDLNVSKSAKFADFGVRLNIPLDRQKVNRSIKN